MGPFLLSPKTYVRQGACQPCKRCQSTGPGGHSYDDLNGCSDCCCESCMIWGVRTCTHTDFSAAESVHGE